MQDGVAVSELVATLRGALSELADRDMTSLADDEVRAALPQLLTAANQLCAVTSQVVGSFDVRGLAELDGFRATRTWLTAFGRMSQGAATGWLQRGRLLRQLPRLAATAGAGDASGEQLGHVLRLASQVGVEQLIRCDATLAELARDGGPTEVAAACERIRAHLDPDGARPDPAGAFDRRELTFSRCGSMTAVRGQLDPEGAAALQTALDALMRPPGPDDLRTPAQRRADALVELARLHLSAGDLPTVGGVRPQIGILVTPSMLRYGSDQGAGTASARAQAPGPHGPPVTPCCGPSEPERVDPLERLGIGQLPELPWAHWVHEIPPELAQRLSCDGQVWRAVLDPGTGLPLEVGRAHRVVPYWIRKALHARDRGCRWPSCDAPAAWTDAHHLLAWWLGGPTDVDNLLLLCRWHHMKVHEGEWKLQLDPATGDVTVTRPDGRPYELGPSRGFVSPGRRSDQAA